MPAEPLRLYLSAQQRHDREQARVLRDAANEAEALMRKLGAKYNFGSEVRQAQIALVLRELRTQQALMWGSIDDTLQNAMDYAADAAAEAEEFFNDNLFRAMGTPSMDALTAANRAQARATAAAYRARTALGIPLSQQVYRTSAFSNGILERRVNNAILLGKSAAEIANDVRDLIRPDVPGGVSYAAKRLGRTELNNAFHQAQKDLRTRDPFVTAMQWNLSSSHPRADDCDVLAHDSHMPGGKAGQFRPEDVPGKPHPQCFCFLTSVTVGDKEFIQNFVQGKYNTAIDRKVHTYAPKSSLPPTSGSHPFANTQLRTDGVSARYMADNAETLIQQGMSEASFNGAQAKAQLGAAIARAEAGEIRRFSTIATGKDPDLGFEYKLQYLGKNRVGRQDYHEFNILRTGGERGGFREYNFSHRNFDRADIQELFDTAEWDFLGVVPKPTVRPLISPKSPGAMTDEDMAILWVKTKDRIANELGISPKGATKELDDRTYKAIGDEFGYSPAEVKAKLDAYRGTGKKLSVLKKQVLKKNPRTKPTVPRVPKQPREVPTKPTKPLLDDVVDNTKKNIADDPGPVYVEEHPGYRPLDSTISDMERLRDVNFRPQTGTVYGPSGPTQGIFYRQYGNVNCVSCSYSYELRLRGLDVRALQDLPDWQKYISTYKDVFGAEVKYYNSFQVSQRTGKYVYDHSWTKRLAQDMPEGARGTITVVHKGGGHIFNWKKQNGRIYFSDAQIRMDWSTRLPIFKRIVDPQMQIMRLDNLPTPSPEKMKQWVDVQ